MDDEVIHPPSMTRAIVQPGYLNQMKVFPSDEHTFHTITLMLLRQFINKLKVFDSKKRINFEKCQKHDLKSAVFLKIQNRFNCFIYSVGGTIWYINTCVWVVEMHLKVLTHSIAHCIAVSLHWNSRLFCVSSFDGENWWWFNYKREK